LHFYSVVDELAVLNATTASVATAGAGVTVFASNACGTVGRTVTELLLRLTALYSWPPPLHLSKVTLISKALKRGQSTEHEALS